ARSSYSLLVSAGWLCCSCGPLRLGLAEFLLDAVFEALHQLVYLGLIAHFGPEHDGVSLAARHLPPGIERQHRLAHVVALFTAIAGHGVLDHPALRNDRGVAADHHSVYPVDRAHQVLVLGLAELAQQHHHVDALLPHLGDGPRGDGRWFFDQERIPRRPQVDLLADEAEEAHLHAADLLDQIWIEQRLARALLDQVGAHDREPVVLHLRAEERGPVSQVALANPHRIGVQPVHHVHDEPGEILLTVTLREEPAVVDQCDLSVLRPDAVHKAGPPRQTPLGDVAATGTRHPLDVRGAQDD